MIFIISIVNCEFTPLINFFFPPPRFMKTLQIEVEVFLFVEQSRLEKSIITVMVLVSFSYFSGNLDCKKIKYYSIYVMLKFHQQI